MNVFDTPATFRNLAGLCRNRTGGYLQVQYHELKKCQKQSLHRSHVGETDFASF